METEVKPGWKTTEWILSAVLVLIGLLLSSGVIGEGSSIMKGMEFIASALVAIGYSTSRALTKKAAVVASAVVASADPTLVE